MCYIDCVIQRNMIMRSCLSYYSQQQDLQIEYSTDDYIITKSCIHKLQRKRNIGINLNGCVLKMDLSLSWFGKSGRTWICMYLLPIASRHNNISFSYIGLFGLISHIECQNGRLPNLVNDMYPWGMYRLNLGVSQYVFRAIYSTWNAEYYNG
jgi:hypothetical protein